MKTGSRLPVKGSGRCLLASRRSIALLPQNFRIFKEMPGALLRDEFREHIAKTGSPETFPGIFGAPLDKKEVFWKIHAFSIDRTKREQGDMAYCPMCHQYNKYLEGEFVWLPRLQAVAAIGHECAAKENRAAADKEYKARKQQEDEEYYLLDNLHYVAARLKVVVAVSEAATEALRIFRLLRKDAPSAVSQLRRVKKNNARLIVVETIDGAAAITGPAGFRGTSGVQTRDAVFGTLSGFAAVQVEFNPKAELDKIAEVLRRHSGCATQNDALNRVCQMSDRDRKWATAELQRAEADFQKLQGKMREFCEFFSAANIERISRWVSHPEHPSPFTVKRIEQSAGTVITIRSAKDDVRVVIKPTLYTYAADWPVASG